MADVFQFVHSFLRPSNFGICRFSSYFGKNRLCVCVCHTGSNGCCGTHNSEMKGGSVAKKGGPDLSITGSLSRKKSRKWEERQSPGWVQIPLNGGCDGRGKISPAFTSCYWKKKALGFKLINMLFVSYENISPLHVIVCTSYRCPFLCRYSTRQRVPVQRELSQGWLAQYDKNVSHKIDIWKESKCSLWYERPYETQLLRGTFDTIKRVAISHHDYQIIKYHCILIYILYAI